MKLEALKSYHKKAWFHLYDEYPVKHEADRLTPPIIADFNGDGKKEVIVATNDAKIQPHTRRVDEGLRRSPFGLTRSVLPLGCGNGLWCY
ncbi:hypothetical protein F2Q69_00061673 [Brassica cretica]|uniref:FG-GAP repeat-containing protein n=1 Tax=Brassica cretica TaxID=69181 RepID=A0A8S9RF30_BRACR|nr:hypothetical protein F2Q69_00061673 [Brassica cretica]